MSLPLLGAGPGITSSHSSQAAAFLARTSGLDATHVNAYYALIDGLVSDGVFSQLDVLHIYATQDSTTALLNLVSTSFTGTKHGAPTFTADNGFTGTSGSSTIYIDTGFNTASISGLNYSENSAHFSAWSLSSGQRDEAILGNSDNIAFTKILSPKQNDGKFYARIHSTSYDGVANAASTVGHYIGSRTTNANIDGYRNASNIYSNHSGTQVAVAGGLINFNYYTLGFNNGGTAVGGTYQTAMLSIGGGLSSADVTAFYNRLRTYMTAVGVP
jgi:hypothetical protein